MNRLSEDLPRVRLRAFPLAQREQRHANLASWPFNLALMPGLSPLAGCTAASDVCRSSHKDPQPLGKHLDLQPMRLDVGNLSIGLDHEGRL